MNDMHPEEDLGTLLAATMAEPTDDGFSDRVMARVEAEALLARLTQDDVGSRWAGPAVALSAGLVAGGVFRILTQGRAWADIPGLGNSLESSLEATTFLGLSATSLLGLGVVAAVSLVASLRLAD